MKSPLKLYNSKIKIEQLFSAHFHTSQDTGFIPLFIYSENENPMLASCFAKSICLGLTISLPSCISIMKVLGESNQMLIR